MGGASPKHSRPRAGFEGRPIVARSRQPSVSPEAPADGGARPTATDPTHIDLALVVGVLSSDPTITDLPSGSTLHRYEVTVRDRSPADSVPVSWFDATRPPALSAGDEVVVVGRVRRRFFRAGGATRSATEIEAERVARAGASVRAVAALDAARTAPVGDG